MTSCDGTVEFWLMGLYVLCLISPTIWLMQEKLNPFTIIYFPQNLERAMNIKIFYYLHKLPNNYILMENLWT